MLYRLEQSTVLRVISVLLLLHFIDDRDAFSALHRPTLHLVVVVPLP